MQRYHPGVEAQLSAVPAPIAAALDDRNSMVCMVGGSGSTVVATRPEKNNTENQRKYQRTQIGAFRVGGGTCEKQAPSSPVLRSEGR
ncbi:hypothetical protein NDU88_002778 [Pleurodeles waltl]|uniref:Uncharacterized protein n=1 Tax=Pleurodeles waltl TaxID=8319 RepID=A0AAV7VEK1_PLEWA|nr:hypothetical protein NDU88_002778 [Pleurodeles waltl]